MTYGALQQKIQDSLKKIAADYEKELLKEYRIAYFNIKRQVQALYANVFAGVKTDQYYNQLLQYGRIKKLETEIASEIARLYRATGQAVRDSAAASMTNSFYYQQYALNWLKPYAFSVLPTKIIDYTINGTPEIFKAIKSDVVKRGLTAASSKTGETLRNLLYRNQTAAVSKIRSTITQGVIRGDGIRDMSKAIEKAMQGNMSSTTRIIQTETHRAASAGEFFNSQIAKEQGVDVVRLLQAVFDMKTRTQSQEVNGRKDTGEGFLYPDGRRYFVPGATGNPAWDINDREYVIDIVDGFTPEVRSARNPATGKSGLIDMQSFGEWATKNNLVRNKRGILQKK